MELKHIKNNAKTLAFIQKMLRYIFWFNLCIIFLLMHKAGLRPNTSIYWGFCIIIFIFAIVCFCIGILASISISARIIKKLEEERSIKEYNNLNN
jgi:ABC-type methionine transport system permease subunit